MASYTVPPVYAAFIWWFSTGAVLLLVGCARRFVPLQAVIVAFLVAGSLCGLAFSAGDASVVGAYVAFTSTILLWGAQEIAFLSGWVTGPRPQRCPVDVTGWRRLGPALAAILYHELTLVACGAAIVALTSGAANQVALWTFAALWVLRQSAKINLFLGVPVTNDELMPQPVQFLKTLLCPQAGRRVFSDIGHAGDRRARDHDPAHCRSRRDPVRCGRPDAGFDAVCARRCRALVHAAAAAGDHAVGLGHALGFPAGGRHHEARTRCQTFRYAAQHRRACECAPRSGAAEAGRLRAPAAGRSVSPEFSRATRTRKSGDGAQYRRSAGCNG